MLIHIHTFTIHTIILVLLKEPLYSRSSRMTSDKLNLGFKYPCDGPGRGGTCQVSSWDHMFLTSFWGYNTSSTVVFNYF